MPGFERFQMMSRELTNAVGLGTLPVTWKDGGKAFEYQKDAKRYRYDIATRTTLEIASAGSGNSRGQADQGGRETRRGQRGGGVPRGRQIASATSLDGKHKVFYRDRNVWLSDGSGSNEVAITSDGAEKSRLKYGTASWVYGEELGQTTAMWWSSNSQKVAFYRFDESKVPDYYLELDQTKVQSKVDTEAYSKAGAPNPVVDLFIYDLPSKKVVKVDVRNGQLFDDSVVGHYIYKVFWSADSSELLFHRTNRRQNILELCAANPETGLCRVVVKDEWPASWVANSPSMRFLGDGLRFVWASERTGWKNFYLYNLKGELLSTLTHHGFEAAEIVHLNEEAGLFYYTAHDGDNPLKLQLHCVGLNGQNDRRLTDPTFHHTIDFAPDGAHYIDVAQTHDKPPVTRLMDGNGEMVAELRVSDKSKFEKLKLKNAELLEFKSADGLTGLYGMLYFPSDFDPGRKYPLLISVYGGPNTAGARETFALPGTMPGVLAEFGFLVATFDSRSAGGRGKQFLDAIYRKLGQPEIDDQAAGVKYLLDRSYVDKTRVGIFGTSYGGYASVMCLLRYPNLFQAAAASSPPTSWFNYDTIYTERYMGLPEDNKEGYDAGSAMKYVNNLKGRLLLYYGTADNNVHPNNSMQLIQALQRAGKSFEVQVGPDLGHGSVNRDRMMEFFIENLVLPQK